MLQIVPQKTTTKRKFDLISLCGSNAHPSAKDMLLKVWGMVGESIRDKDETAFNLKTYIIHTKMIKLCIREAYSFLKT